MPIDYQIDKLSRLVLSTARGAVTAQDLLNHHNRLRQDPEFSTSFRQLYHMIDVVNVALSDRERREVAVASAFGPGARRAFVAEEEEVRQRLAAYQEFRKSEGDLIKIFSNVPDALRWLSVFEDSAFKTLFDADPDAMMVVDPQGVILLANQQTLNLFGYAQEDLVGHQVEQLIPDRYATHAQLRNQYFTDPHPLAMEERQNLFALASDGKEIPVEISLNPATLQGDQFFVATIRDVTEKRQTQTALENQQLVMRNLLDALPLLVIVYEQDGSSSFANAQAQRIVGIAAEQFGNQTYYIAGTNVPYPREKSPRFQALEGNSCHIDDMEVERKDGSRMPIEVWSTPLRRNDSGQVLQVVVAAVDISDRKETEQELQKLAKLESIGVLAGGIAHDLNNFLMGIVGHISLARMDDDAQRREENLKAAEDAAMRVKNLTHQLLTFSKGGTPVLRNVGIGDILEDTIRFSLSGSNVKSEIGIPVGLWTTRIDEAQIRQVINNIVINAKQAMPTGGVLKISAKNESLRTNRKMPLDAGAYVAISFEDVGVGISEADCTKIFDPFFSTKQMGSGLGLATSHSVIQQHKGHITVESEPGVGTKFVVYLPAVPEETPQTIKPERAGVNLGAGRVLVMDDEKFIRDLAIESFGKLGYEVITCSDGAEAIERYSEYISSGNPFDVVVLDLTIRGGIGGCETVARLRKIDPQVKAICVSGYSNDPIMANYDEYGFEGALAKPYGIRELGELLNDLVGTH